MNPSIYTEMLTWTPSLLNGFGLNIAISLVAMIAGTSIGWLLASGRNGSYRGINIGCNIATGLFRNIPSFVLMFYIAFIIPIEFEWQGQLIQFPAWIKASIALAVPVIGFTSDQFLYLRSSLKQNNTVALPMFFIAWTQYFVIILMASSTASVIGVHEIVGRANTAIEVLRDPEFMLWIYLYVAAWFLLAAMAINVTLKIISKRIHQFYR
jgi:polar amino acid transport system permease protein